MKTRRDFKSILTINPWPKIPFLNGKLAKNNNNNNNNINKTSGNRMLETYSNFARRYVCHIRLSCLQSGYKITLTPSKSIKQNLDTLLISNPRIFASINLAEKY